MADAQKIAAVEGITSFEKMASWVLDTQKARIMTLPGFVSAEDALLENENKLAALREPLLNPPFPDCTCVSGQKSASSAARLAQIGSFIPR